MSKFWVALVRDGDHRRYLMCDHRGVIQIWPSKTDALRFFEESYWENHVRSQEASVSAIIHYNTFEPVVVRVSMSEMEAAVERESGGLLQIFALNSIAGNAHGILVQDGPQLQTWLQTGTKPRLVEPE